MKSVLVAVTMLAAAIQPAMAQSCWSTENGSHLLFAPHTPVATYWHGGMTESCTLHPLSWSKARVWCENSSVSGITRIVASHRGASQSDRVYWDGQVYYRDDCPAW